MMTAEKINEIAMIKDSSEVTSVQVQSWMERIEAQ